jgi:septal ring factor EnvC (AmiA/AmiB activator)
MRAPGKHSRWIVAGAALALLVALAGASAQEQDLDRQLREKDVELRKLREEIAEQRRRIAEVEKKERDAADYLKKLENEERLTKRLLGGLNDKEAMLERQASKLRGDLAYSETVYRRRLSILAGRLRGIYKDGTKFAWQELLGAGSFDDLLNRYKYLSAIAEQDANLVEEVRQRKATIGRQEAGITENLYQVSAARKEKETELGRLRENERKRQPSLAELKTSKKKYQKRIEDLAKAEQEILSIIGDLERARAAAAPADEAAYAEKDFPSLKGRMAPPVAGKTVRGFGQSKHPEFGTVTNNTGIDIEARPGSPVRAVARGKVEYASLLPGFGNCIIIAHGAGYYTLYAHTSKIFVKQGAMVSGGDLIAEVGDAASGASAPFHFEIRKSKTPLDPAQWLK